MHTQKVATFHWPESNRRRLSFSLVLNRCAIQSGRRALLDDQTAARRAQKLNCLRLVLRLSKISSFQRTLLNPRY